MEPRQKQPRRGVFFLAKFLLAAISLLIIGPLLAEALFRLGIAADVAKLRTPGLYAHLSTDDYWKMTYLWRIRDGVGTARIHPTLGWAFPRTEENPMGITKPVPKRMPPSDETVLLFGDSFAAGFGMYLNRALPDQVVINFGVGGYGTDQILMRMRESLPIFPSPKIVVSVLTTDMDRSMLSFRSGQKPFFEIEDDELIKQGLPIFPTTDEYLAENPIGIRSFIWAMLGQKMAATEPKDRNDLSPYKDMMTLNRKIIEKLVIESKERDASAIFIVFYTERDIRLNTWRGPFIIEELQKLDAKIVDTKPLLLELAEAKGLTLKELYRPDNHLDILANEFIADRTAMMLLDEWTGTNNLP